MRATWDCHRGGVFSLESASAEGLGRVSVAARVVVRHKGREICLLQEHDPAPRLIICEQGPVRIVLRVMYSLLDEQGVYHGDGLTDVVIYADGEVQLAFGLRLVDSTAHDSVVDAGIRFGVERGWEPQGRQAQRGRTIRFAAKRTPRFILLASGGTALAFAWYSRDGAAEDRLGGVGMWHGPRPRPPYYDMWGHLYDQWGGLSGWAAHRSGLLVPEREENGATVFNFRWLHRAEEPCGELFGMRALLGLFFESSSLRAQRRVAAFLKPYLPTAVSGAEFRCLDLVENSLLYLKTDTAVRLVFPRDPLGRRVRLRVFGLSGGYSVAARCNGRTLPVQLLSDGGLTDDPYGPNHARPDSRFALLVGDPAKGPHHAVFSVQLSPQRVTTVDLTEVSGVSCSYLKWDDRQIYVLRAGGTDSRPIGLFSPLTLALHELRCPGAAEPALVRVPLFWYPTNVQTRGQCFNELRRLKMQNMDSAALELSIESCDPNERAISECRAVLTTSSDTFCLRVQTRLHVLKPLDLGSIQYLNAFPCNSWRTRDWCGNWILALSRNGGRMLKWYKETREAQEQWKHFQYWRKRLVLVYGSSPHGNVFITAEARRPLGQLHGYVLCPVWLDSHFTVEKLKTPIRPGTMLETAYCISISGHQGLSVGEARIKAEQMLRARIRATE